MTWGGGDISVSEYWILGGECKIKTEGGREGYLYPHSSGQMTSALWREPGTLAERARDSYLPGMCVCVCLCVGVVDGCVVDGCVDVWVEG